MTRLNPITTPRHQLRAEKARRNREAALNAFIAKKAEIDQMLIRLQALSDDHFNCHPDEVGWAMVGSMNRKLVARLTRSAASENIAGRPGRLSRGRCQAISVSDMIRGELDVQRAANFWTIAWCGSEWESNC